MAIRASWQSTLAAVAATFFFAAGAQAQGLTKMVFLEGSPPSTASVNIYVADQAGFFKEEGLEVEINYAANGSVATQAVANNNADVGDVTFEPFLIGYDQGLRGKFIYNRWDKLIYYIGVPLDSPIKTIKDLEGKKIGVSNMGSSSLIFARSMLRGAGIQPSNDIFVPVGVGDGAVAAINSGQIQALSLFNVIYAGLERSGHQLRYIYHPKIAAVGDGGMFVSDKTLKEKPEALQKFVRALAKADIFIAENKEATVKIYWKANPPAKPAGSEEEAMKRGLIELNFISPKNPPKEVGVFDKEGITQYLQVLLEEGIVKRKFTYEDFIDNRFQQKAVAEVDVEAVRAKAKNWK